MEDGSKIKAKGAFARAGLQKNPTNEIILDAIEGLLLKGTPVEETVRGCTDISKFLSVRTVKGGAYKDGEFLGKAIRWYYKQGEEGTIIYAESGKKVPKSDGAQPLMDLPDEMPTDIDYDWYIQESYKNLDLLAYSG